MAGNGDSNQQGIPINATTVLALLTLLGGVLLVSHTLSSDRPVASSGAPNPEISEQKFDTRLWEDPFGQSSHLASTNEVRLGNVAGDLMDPQNADFRLVAVMVPGGPASEDRERRIRSRFAIVSALAESAYAPRHQAHIGIGKMDWPTSLQLSAYMTNSLPCTNPTNRSTQTNLPATGSASESTRKTPNAINQTNASADINSLPNSYSTGLATNTSLSNRMFFAFEWYEWENFVQHPTGSPTNQAPVLVVWLDEDQFDDYLIPRLDLFFYKLGGTNQNWKTNLMKSTSHSLALIGPGRSDTLKPIFAGDFDNNRRAVGDNWTNWTREVSLFLASPQAIDEVLVNTPDLRDHPPRQVLLTKLGELFKQPRNFAATDSDLAHEVVDEIKERHVDLTATNTHHLVLIGGWDEYFGRMQSAAYAAELAVRQKQATNRATFLDGFRDGRRMMPTNLHSFLYLSGLDGQGLSSEAKNNPMHERDTTGPRSEDSAKEKAARWTPDANRAEGPAQYDYLGRLAGRIEDLNAQLLREGKGMVSAIGIGGGDAYDTLLILQALRPRFPEAIFFVTELDARFWDPKEWLWSRNLVVVSGYGLRLNKALQRQTAPFRDSEQTAVFAAALAALGNTNVPTLTSNFPVRRFEIGRNGPVDLSTAKDTFLHPDLKEWLGFWSWLHEEYRFWAVLFILAGGLLLAITLSCSFRLLTFRLPQFLAEPLWLQEEDIGGLKGFNEIARHLGRPPSEPVPDQKQRLRGKMKEIIEHEEEEMDRAVERQGTASIFTEADILNPTELVKALKADQKPMPDFLRRELPAQTKLLLDKWDGDSGDPPASLEMLIEGLRVIINTVDLPGEGREALRVRWRNNRELLARAFPGVLRHPVSLSELFFSPGPRENDNIWRKELEEALREPKRRDCLRSAMLQALDAWNAQLARGFFESPADAPSGAKEKGRAKQPRQEIPPIRFRAELNYLKANRKSADEMIAQMLQGNEAAGAARAVSWDLYHLCCLRWALLAGIGVVAVGVCGRMFYACLTDTPYWGGELSGASLWPSNWLNLLGVVLGLLFISESYFQLRKTLFETTRQCRFDYRPPAKEDQSQRAEWRSMPWLWWKLRETFYPSASEPVAVVVADEAWKNYRRQGHGRYRLCRTILFVAAYFVLLQGAYLLVFGHLYEPFLRKPAGNWYLVLVNLAFILFLFLSFWTIDAAYLCRWFILRISQGPTLYSLATQQHFSRQHGQVPHDVLSEWIDVSVIASITERVGMLLYFPAVLFLLLILASHSLLYYWPWPPAFYVLATCNFGVAAASIVILQRAARRARDRSADALQEKLEQLKAGAAATETEKKQHDINETQELLEAIRNLKKGAFAGLWGNPVVGALLVPSSGTALIEIIRYLAR